MYYINYLFDMENNYLIGGILLGVVLVLAGGLAALTFLLKKPLFGKIGAVVSGLLIVVTSLFCYNELVMVAFLIAIAVFALFMAHICQEYHKKTIYEIPFWKLYFRMFFPTFVASLLFRPWFSEESGAWYRVLPGFGMNVTGTYVYDVTVINEGATATVWNIISVVQALLFLAVLTMQALLIWREFADPDNAPTWATFGLIVTGIGGMFIYGVYTSPNFRIATFMQGEEKMIIEAGALIRKYVFTPVESNVNNITLAPVLVVLSGIANRLFYIEKRK